MKRKNIKCKKNTCKSILIVFILVSCGFVASVVLLKYRLYFASLSSLVLSRLCSWMLFTHLKLSFLWFHSVFNFRTFICHLLRASPMSIRNNARSLQPLTFNSFYAFINCLQDAQGHCSGHYLHWQAAVWKKHQDASKHRGMDSIKHLKKI